MLKNTLTTYGSIAKFFHWTVSICIFGLLTIGTVMTNLPETSPSRDSLFNGHKLTGLTVLTLVILRLCWRLMNIQPQLPNTVPLWEKVAERFIQILFYFVILAMPLSGWFRATAAGYPPKLLGFDLGMPGILKDESLSKLASSVHYFLAWTIVTLLVIHIGAALKHHLIDKDNVLRRMLPR